MKFPSTNGGPVTLHLTIANLTEADAQFIRNVRDVFCDPRLQERARRIRAGRECLIYESGGGLAAHPFNPKTN